jgi:putative ABC transport system permease protein
MPLRQTLRGLRHSPGFTLTVILTLALSIGANTAIFSAVHTLLLRPLPYRDADRLVFVTEFWPHEPIAPGPASPDFGNWRRQSELAQQIEAYGGGATLNLTAVGEPERIQATMVSAGFLELIGAQLEAGRNFTREEDVLKVPPAAILGYDLWRRRFQGSRDILNKPIQLNGRAYTVVGILPAGFEFPDNNFGSTLLVPIALAPDLNWHDADNFRFLRVLARTKPGVTPEALRTEFAGILAQHSSEEPPQFTVMRKDIQVRTQTLRERLTGDIRPLMLVLQGAVAMVLLIGCLNIANLQISRSVAREKEMAVRAALGAGRTRIVRDALTESVLLSLTGAATGLLLAWSTLNSLRAFLPANLHLAESIHIDVTVLLFTAAAGILTGILTGLTSLRTHDTLSRSRTLPRSRTLRGAPHVSAGTALVVAEVAIAVVVLASCGLLVRSFVKMASVPLGFNPKNILTLRLNLGGAKYSTEPKQAAFLAQILNRARALPGVETAAVGSGLPLIGTRGSAGVSFQDRPEPPLGGRPTMPFCSITPGYFQALSIPLLLGRDFTIEDTKSGYRVAIVNQAFIDTYYKNQDPLGKRIEVGSHEGLWAEIVGVVGNVRQQGLSADESPKVFSLMAEPEMLLVVKSATPPTQLIAAVTQTIHEIDPNQPVFDVLTMEQRISQALSSQRANMILMSILAALALALAAIGIFGVIAYFVTRRSREIGIRMAIGAQRHNILAMVLRKGLGMTILGMAIGMAGALASTRALKSLLFSTTPTDATTFVLIASFFALIATAATLLPALRASNIDPAAAIRHD